MKTRTLPAPTLREVLRCRARIARARWCMDRVEREIDLLEDEKDETGDTHDADRNHAG